MTTKTLLVAWDAAPWDMLEPLLDRQALPVLQQLMNAGCYGTLRSTIPPITAVAWSTLLTGKLPQKHGVYDWIQGEGEKVRFASSDQFLGTPIWERLNAQGIKVGLVNIPATFPPPEVDGFVVAGLGAPSPPAQVTYPPEVLDWITKTFGEYIPAHGLDVVRKYRKQKDFSGLFAAELQLQARQVEIALQLADQYAVDFLAINLMLFDHVNHWMPDTKWTDQAFQELDRQLGRLLSEFEPDNVILISDHGARRVKGQFMLGNWLCDRGYLKRHRREEQSKGDLNFLLQCYLEEGRSFSGLLLRSLRWAMRNLIPLLPHRLAQAFWRDVQRRVPGAYRNYWFEEAIDVETSPVLRIRNSGTVYLNHKLLSPAPQYLEAIREELREKLSLIQNPETHTPLFESIQLFESGNASSDRLSPDLFLNAHSSAFTLYTARGADFKSRYPYFVYMEDNPEINKDAWSGDHALDGVFVLSGRDFAGGQAEETQHIVDIPATLLHLCNVPVPEDYDGQVLTEALRREQSVRTQPGDDPETLRQQRETISAPDQTDEVLDRLRALGYVD